MATTAYSAEEEYRQEQIASLREVLAILETVPPEQFNMQHWWLDDGIAFDDERNQTYKVADGPCGCVVGHLIQRGLLSGEIIAPQVMPAGTLPYEYRDRIWVQISDALGIHNQTITEWLFSQYAYPRAGCQITLDDVKNRIQFSILELNRKGASNGPVRTVRRTTEKETTG